MSGAAAVSLGRLLDVVLPPRCLLCGEACRPGAGRVCARCDDALPRIRGRRCARCGMELVSERLLCTRCREREYAFERNAALYPYLGEVRELLRQYKSAGHRSLARFLARGLAELYRAEYPGRVVVPVPGRAAVSRRRGWEHVDLVSRILERRYGLPVARCLRRKAGGGEQKSLDSAARARNMEGAFAVAGPVPPGDVVLLDDLLTTGATLSACAAVLIGAGVRSVCCMTVAVDE